MSRVREVQNTKSILAFVLPSVASHGVRRFIVCYFPVSVQHHKRFLSCALQTLHCLKEILELCHQFSVLVQQCDQGELSTEQQSQLDAVAKVRTLTARRTAFSLGRRKKLSPFPSFSVAEFSQTVELTVQDFVERQESPSEPSSVSTVAAH